MGALSSPWSAEIHDELIVVTGHLRYAGAGLSVTVEGEWTYHEDRGRQIAAKAITATLPDTAVEIKRYLASKAIPGIGKMIPFHLTQRFGDNVFCIVRDAPERLKEAKGMTEAPIAALLAAVASIEGTGAQVAPVSGATQADWEAACDLAEAGDKACGPGDLTPELEAQIARLQFRRQEAAPAGSEAA